MRPNLDGEGRIPFRLRIGVTGHRDPADWGELAIAVRRRLTEVRELLPSTDATRTVFVVLSALAQGADQLVAREAIDLLVEDDVELHAVLPLSLEDYRNDFREEDAAGAKAFDDLLSSTDVCTQMPPAKSREQAYANAGRFIVDHSDVIVALWDGHSAEGLGGTSEVVSYAREQGVAVLVVPTVRTSHIDRAVQEENLHEQTRSTRFASVEKAFRRIDQYNQRPMEESHLRRHLERVRPPAPSAPVDATLQRQYEAVAAWAWPHFARADFLALRSQRLYYHLGDTLYILAALALTTVALQAEAGLSTKLALVEVAFMLALLSLYFVARRLQLQDRWLGYRSLAEAFRSGLFITITGAVGARDGDGRGKLGDFLEPWHQRAFSEAWSHRPPIATRRSRAAELRRFLVEAWLEDQIRYHHEAARRCERRNRRLTEWVFALFGVTVLIGCLHAFEVGDAFWPHLFVFLAIALPGFGAALTGIRDHRQFRVHQDRSLRTAHRLERLQRKLESQTATVSIRKLAAEMQAVIEAENHDWSGMVEFLNLEMVM